MPTAAQALMSALIVTALALAGCAGGDEEDGSSTSTSSSRTATTTTSRTGGNDGNNHAPTGSISASVEQGPVPVQVTFDLQGTDQDGDALSWNLDLDGDGNTDKSGEALPAQETYNYTTEGSFNVTFVVTDGDASATYTVTIDATAAVGGTGPIQTIEGSWQLGNPPVCGGSYANPYHPANEAGNEVFMLSAAVDPNTIGRTFTAEFGAAGPGQVSVHVHFSNPDTIIVGDPFAGTSPLSGPVPAEAEMVTFQVCGPSGTSVTYTA